MNMVTTVNGQVRRFVDTVRNRLAGDRRRPRRWQRMVGHGCASAAGGAGRLNAAGHAANVGTNTSGAGGLYRALSRQYTATPPYAGVHVLYHRWQVDGRKEAPLPFMIANKLDGAFGSYYTMGDRKYPGLKTYFDNIRATMASIAALADEHTFIVQMVGFSNPKWQLPRYLETMEEIGLQEMFLPKLHGEGDGRLWRSVPGQRWYIDQRGNTPGSREVVLLHVQRRSAAN